MIRFRATMYDMLQRSSMTLVKSCDSEPINVLDRPGQTKDEHDARILGHRHRRGNRPGSAKIFGLEDRPQIQIWRTARGNGTRYRGIAEDQFRQ